MCERYCSIGDTGNMLLIDDNSEILWLQVDLCYGLAKSCSHVSLIDKIRRNTQNEGLPTLQKPLNKWPLNATVLIAPIIMDESVIIVLSITSLRAQEPTGQLSEDKLALESLGNDLQIHIRIMPWPLIELT